MGLMIEEQETHINFSRGDGRAEIYTSDTTMMVDVTEIIDQ